MLFTFVIGICAIMSMGFAQSVEHPDGSSTQYGSRKDNGVFNFHYGVHHATGAENSREESGDALGNRVGSYTIRDSDGRSRTVRYTADKHGFRATITTNEHGTDNQSPANVTLYVNNIVARALRSSVQPIPYLFKMY